MQVRIKDIEVDEAHRYFHKDFGLLPSVTTIVNGKSTDFVNDKMARGTAIHKVLEYYFKNNKAKAKEIYNSLDGEDKEKVKAIYEFVNNNYNQKIATELSFVANDNNVKFAGTIDLISPNTVIDFKTGKLDYTKYLMQISAYAFAMSPIKYLKEREININNASVLYFENNKLKQEVFTHKDIHQGYQDFLSKARNMQDIKTPLDLEIEELAKQYASNKEMAKRAEEENSQLKEQIEHKLKSAGLTKFYCDKVTAYYTKGSESKNLKKECKEKLLESNPDYFITTVSKPSFNIKTK